MRIPTELFEKKIDAYLDDNFTFEQPNELIANQLYKRFMNRHYTYGTLLYMVDLWKRGWFKQRYKKKKNYRESEYLELKEILKNISEREGK